MIWLIKPERNYDMNKTDKIYVAGHRGLVGSAIVRNLQSKGYNNIVGRTHKELELTDQQAVRAFFEEERPDVVVLAAAKVGGINANNTTPAEFIYDNMQVQCNVIHCCHQYGIKKLLFLFHVRFFFTFQGPCNEICKPVSRMRLAKHGSCTSHVCLY